MNKQTIKEKVLKIIKRFEKLHKSVDEEGNTDCAFIDNEIYRIAPKGEWLGTEEERQKELKEQKIRDKNIYCYVCEFIKKLKERR